MSNVGTPTLNLTMKIIALDCQGNLRSVTTSKEKENPSYLDYNTCATTLRLGPNGELIYLRS